MVSRVTVFLLTSLVVLMPIGLTTAQDPEPFKAEQLDALTAPIALYPDSLLAQVLMAATYPTDVAAAAEWSEAHKDQEGDAAVKAVEAEVWDPSVKSLVAFPAVLAMMKEKPDWVQQMGDAFLAQSKDVMDSVQRLRKQAKDAGNLESTKQQVVTEEPSTDTTPTTAAQPTTTTTVAAPPTTIVIESADPEVIYVPSYNPTVVYGSWMYPSYPPTYFPPPPGYVFGSALATGFAFATGVAIADSLWGDCNWGGGDVDINVNKYNNVNVNNKINSGNTSWNHNAANRGGTPYRDSASRDKYSKNVPGAEQRSDYRGRDAGATSAADSTRDAQREAARSNVEQRTGVSTRDAAGAADRVNSDLSNRGQSASDLGRGDAGGGNRDLGGATGAGGNRDVGGGGAGTRDAAGSRGGASASTRDAGSSRGGSSGASRSSSAFSDVQRPAASQQSVSRGSSSAGGRSMSSGGGGGGRSGGGGGGRRR